MLECLIMGDSIAVGIAMHRPECRVEAVVGINSKMWNVKYGGKKHEARTAIISLSTNDHANIDTVKELTQLRSEIVADKVFWVMPARYNKAFDIVRTLARENGDTFLISANLAPDGIHPTTKSYRKLADQSR
jgi:hypothetical protein